MTASLTTRARAKVNLTLHVLGRRPDGYHELESLVAFAGVADTLSLTPGPRLGLTVGGARAAGAGAPDRNLVIRAATALVERVPGLQVGCYHLEKRLPAAAGIGGGSADAAGALRLLARLNGLSLDHPALLEAARATGADVPVCLASRTRMMRGAGEVLGPLLPGGGWDAVLVNPGVPVATAPVFAILGLRPGEMLDGAVHPPLGDTADELFGCVREGRNDLEAPATALAPEIGTALARLEEQAGCRLARMSGSGATTFGLFESRTAAEQAARTITRGQPGWWVRATRLG